MKINPAIFKAYDIRGLYPREINEEVARRLGHGLAAFFKKKTAVVGYDARLSSRTLERELVRGLRESGVDVIRIGMVPTPVVSFAVLSFKAGIGVVVSASHSPRSYNAFKIIDERANQIGWEQGLTKIAGLMVKPATPSDEKGKAKTRRILPLYRRFLIKKFKKRIKPLRIAIDYGNGVGAKTSRPILARLGIRAKHLFPEPDGRFPNHEPNPHEPKNFRWLQKELRQGTYDLGIFFDGDADRAIFFDRWGNALRPDVSAGIMALALLKQHPGGEIYHDLRFSKAVIEEIRKAGGRPRRMPVGSPYYKDKIPESEHALLGAELSGHVMFRDFWGIDDGLYAALKMLECISKSRKHLDELAKPFLRYAQSGEISIAAKDPEDALKQITQRFRGGKRSSLDGLSVEYPDWWFNVRASNTEPLLRLNVEARDQQRLRRELATLLRSLKDA